MHQAVALPVPDQTGLRGCRRRVGHELGLLTRIKGTEPGELIGGGFRVIGPGEIERVMAAPSAIARSVFRSSVSEAG
jgi:hypothetical protein